jgi:acyl CoA:acetate/3-ketoacid CoA transferase beta subunit
VFKFIDKKLVLTDINKNTTVDDVKNNTGCAFEIASELKYFE